MRTDWTGRGRSSRPGRSLRSSSRSRRLPASGWDCCGRQGAGIGSPPTTGCAGSPSLRLRLVSGVGPDGMCSWSKALRAQRPEKSGIASAPIVGALAVTARLTTELARSRAADEPKRSLPVSPISTHRMRASKRGRRGGRALPSGPLADEDRLGLQPLAERTLERVNERPKRTSIRPLIPLLGDRDRERHARFVADHSRDVTLTGQVFGEVDAAGVRAGPSCRLRVRSRPDRST